MKRERGEKERDGGGRGAVADGWTEKKERMAASEQQRFTCLQVKPGEEKRCSEEQSWALEAFFDVLAFIKLITYFCTNPI